MSELTDVFNSAPFSTVELTAALDLLPHLPGRTTDLRLFEPKPVKTTTIAIEMRQGVLAILPTKSRTEQPAVHRTAKRVLKSFVIPHVPEHDFIPADDLTDQRPFGETQSNTGMMAATVNDHLEEMKRNHALTWEHHNVGAINGIVYDADGSTVLTNLFTAFDVTEQTVDFDINGTDFTTNGVDVRLKCMAVLRAMEVALGLDVGASISVHAFCSTAFFEDLIGHESARTAYERWNQGEILRADARRQFMFAGIHFEEYAPVVDGVSFIPSGYARFFPKGVPGLFKRFMAPAPFNETVNTMGLELYAKQEIAKFQTGVELMTSSDVLPLCLRPGCLIKGTNT